MTHDQLLEKYSNIVTLEDLKEVMKDCLPLASQERDPVAGFLLAQLLGNFKEMVSVSVIESVVADADFYFSFAFHRFRELADGKDGNAARWVAQYYLNGFAPVERNEADYAKWLKLAAEYGDKLAQAELRDANR